MIKTIEVKKFSTHASVKIWERTGQIFPRVRVASINKQGRSPYLSRILTEEQDVKFSDTLKAVLVREL